MMNWSSHEMAPWTLLPMGVGMLLLWTLVILAIVALVRHLGRRTDKDTTYGGAHHE